MRGKSGNFIMNQGKKSGKFVVVFTCNFIIKCYSFFITFQATNVPATLAPLNLSPRGADTFVIQQTAPSDNEGILDLSMKRIPSASASVPPPVVNTGVHPIQDEPIDFSKKTWSVSGGQETTVCVQIHDASREIPVDREVVRTSWHIPHSKPDQTQTMVLAKPPNSLNLKSGQPISKPLALQADPAKSYDAKNINNSSSTKQNNGPTTMNTHDATIINTETPTMHENSTLPTSFTGSEMEEEEQRSMKQAAAALMDMSLNNMTTPPATPTRLSINLATPPDTPSSVALMNGSPPHRHDEVR